MIGKKRKSTFLIILLIMAFAVTSAIFSSCNYLFTFSSAEALTVSSAVSVGGGTDLWDSANNKINETVLADLVTKLFGTHNPVDYIKSGDVDSGSHVIPASKINEKVNNANGIVVNFGNNSWMISSLTLADVGSDTDQVVATLYLANAPSSLRYNSSNANEKGSNMYSSSSIRNTLLTSTSFASYSTGDLSNYLVQPKYISYQQNQSLAGRVSGYYNCPNDALGAISSGWYNSDAEFLPDFTYNGVKYDAWGDDYIWIPSITEIGFTGDESASIWKLSSNQRAHTVPSGTNRYTWVRSGFCKVSGDYNYFKTGFVINTSGDINWNDVNIAYGLRPAIHLNLTKAGMRVKVPTSDPSSVVYNGQVQNLDTLKTNGVIDWFYSDVMTASYASDDTYIDAGRHTVTVTLPNDKLENGDFVYYFDGATTERSHTYTISISKKSLEVLMSLDSGTGLPQAVIRDGTQIYDSDTGDRAPVLALKYTGRNGTANPSDNTVVPTRMGYYTATAYISNECNYQVDMTKTYQIDFEVGKERLARPSIDGSDSRVYNGELQKFYLYNYSDAESEKINLLVNQVGVEIKHDSTGWWLEAKNADTYTVTVSLANTAETEWASEGNDSFDLSITIERKTLDLTISGLPSSFGMGSAPTITITDNDSYSNDRIILYVYYILNSDPNTKHDEIDGNKQLSEDGKVVTITMPASIVRGNYTLCVELYRGSGALGANNNYEIFNTTKTAPFTVVGNTASITESDIVWKYSLRNVDTAITSTVNFSVPYAGENYTFFIDESNLASKGVKIDSANASYTNGYTGDITAINYRATAYSVTVHLVELSSAYDSYSASFTLRYNITQIKYNLSDVTWDYDPTVLIYDGNMKTVQLTNLPSGLTARYSGNSRTDVSLTDYTASVAFTNTNANYIDPISSNASSYDGDFDWTLSWNITPQEISTATAKWIDVPYNYNGTPDTVPKLASIYDEYVEYEFKDESGQIVLLENITIEMGSEKNYTVRAVLRQGVLNYTIGNQDNPHSFTLGKFRTPITITVSGTSHTFDGTEKSASFTSNTLSQSDFEVQYIDSMGQTLAGAPIHAGTYFVMITLNSDRVDNYYIVNGDPVEITISPARIDLSNLRWNYDSANPFQYKREGGEIASYTVELVGWEENNVIHEYVKSLLQYSGTIEASTVSSVARPYNATFDFIGLVESDFEDFTLPDELQSKSLDWHIAKRVIQKPVYNGENIIFSNEDIDLLVLFGISGDWAEYFTITARYNNEPTAEYTAKNVGTYTFVCNFLPEINDNNDNVSWDDGDTFFATASVTIDPRIINVTGWSSERIPSPIVDDVADLDFINRVYTDSEGNVVSRTDVNNTFNTSFRVTISSSFGDNVVIRTDDGIDDYKEFSTPADPNNPPTPVAKPTIENAVLQYTSYPVTFVINGYNDSYMTMSGGLTYTDEGEYQLIIRFRDGANYCWDDGTRDPIVFTLTVFNDPDNPYIPPQTEKDKGFLEKVKDFFNNLIESHFPLWQVITMAFSALLALIFMIKAIQYGNRKKKAKGEAKKYNAKTYATLLPIFSGEVVALGLSNQIWSILAFAMVGLALLMFVIALILRHGWKKALRAKEAMDNANGVGMQNMGQVGMQGGIAQGSMIQQAGMLQGGIMYSGANIEEILRRHDEERRQDEERHRKELEMLREEQRRENERRDEEQAKRDEAMKLMLANMMGRQQGENGIESDFATINDTDLLVQKVIAGLLPMVQQMIPEPTAYLSAPDSANNQELMAMTNALQQQNAQIAELQEQIASMSQNRIVEAELLPDNSEELRAMAEAHSAEMKAMSEEHSAEMQAMSAQMASMQQTIEMMSAMSIDEMDDTDFDDEEEWDSILDEDDDDFVESVIIEEDGTVKKTSPNFRMRLKQSSDKNREWYAVVKNMFCSQKGITYRVCKRVEKIRYQGQVIAVIGIAKRSIKLWLALKPYEYDARRYHHKDVSDKPRFVDVPMYVRVGSDRALTRAQELILALFQELNMEARKRYNDRDIQELIFTLKHNRLLANKQNKQLLCEVMHVHDCNVLDDEIAEKCIESKNVDFIDESVIETVKLDDIDAKFQDGNRVTLERLKKVGLVSDECTAYKVVADKRLTKPLIIVANDFTLTAVKLIALTGGRAIKLNKI